MTPHAVPFWSEEIRLEGSFFAVAAAEITHGAAAA
jgi:hypothetical protein